MEIVSLELGDLESNKNAFLRLLDRLGDSSCSIKDYLINKTDFFEAPASVRYHLAVEGGLCEHTLNVYYNLVNLNRLFNTKYSDETLLKVGLFHELGKANFYEQYYKNVQVENKWTKSLEYKVRNAEDREIFGDIGLNSYIIASRYVPFSDDEITALCNYTHVNNPNYMEINSVVAKCPLVLLLFMACQSSMYIQDNLNL